MTILGSNLDRIEVIWNFYICVLEYPCWLRDNSANHHRNKLSNHYIRRAAVSSKSIDDISNLSFTGGIVLSTWKVSVDIWRILPESLTAKKYLSTTLFGVTIWEHLKRIQLWIGVPSLISNSVVVWSSKLTMTKFWSGMKAIDKGLQLKFAHTVH